MLQHLKTPFFHNGRIHGTAQCRFQDQNLSIASSLKPNSHSLRKSTSYPRLGLLAPVAQILKSSADLVNSTVSHFRDDLMDEERLAHKRLDERTQILRLRLENAQNPDDWRAAACELDLLEGNEAWKADPKSDEYDVELVAARLAELDDARISCDIPRMLYLIRTALSRDLGGMDNIRLYQHSYVGTKNLIERYMDSVLATIKSLVSLSEKALPDGVETKDILEQIVYARQAFGRSALLVSGGGTYGMNHIGVLKALFDAHLLPRIISGASAGSIVCAVLCTRTDEEIPEVLERFPYGDLAVFEEDGNEDGILQRLGRLLTHGAWIDSKHLIRVMRGMMGDMTFQEAYNRTRRILSISVSSESIYELPRLLNYVTAPNVMIWSAVAASCSVPILFSGASLLVKNPVTGEHQPWNPTPQRWIDGSVDNDLPLTRLSEMFNVNSTITSQVNPHVVPFLAKDEANIAHSAQSSASDWAFTLTSLAKSEALHRMSILADLGIFPNLITKARSILSQKYSGDITILPEVSYRDFPKILKNPTPEFMKTACLRGERATWPKLSRIRNHCAVELELDWAVQALRARVVFSPSQVDLRRLSSPMLNGEAERGSLGPPRNRHLSSNNVQALESKNDDDIAVIYPQSEKTGRSRPPLRATSSHWTAQTRRYLPPLSTPAYPLSKINSAPSSARPLAENDFSDYSSPTPVTRSKSRRRPFYISLPSPNRASETEQTDKPLGFESSDADIDSHTDDSSPEPDGSPRDDLYIQLHHSILDPSRSWQDIAESMTSPEPLFAPLAQPIPGLWPRQETASPSPTPTPRPSSLSLNATMPPSLK